MFKSKSRLTLGPDVLMPGGGETPRIVEPPLNWSFSQWINGAAAVLRQLCQQCMTKRQLSFFHRNIHFLPFSTLVHTKKIMCAPQRLSRLNHVLVTRSASSIGGTGGRRAEPVPAVFRGSVWLSHVQSLGLAWWRFHQQARLVQAPRLFATGSRLDWSGLSNHRMCNWVGLSRSCPQLVI